MSDSDADLFKVLSDFIKGKTGPDGVEIAKLSWDGTGPPIPPQLPDLSRSYSEFAKEYAIVTSGISRCHRPTSLAVIGAMLTLPELQSNCYRLEVLAHLITRFAAGKTPPTAGQICAWFNQLDEGTCGRQEDPAEDLFLSNVYFGSSNYRLFEGTAEGNAFYTQVFLDVLSGMPDVGEYLSLKRSVRALLILSDAIASRAGLPRNIAGNPIPRRAISKPKEDVNTELRQRVVFSEGTLSDLGVQIQDLDPFIFDETSVGLLEKCGPGQSPLEHKPLVHTGGRIIVVLPTTIGTAIRALMIEGALQRSLTHVLEDSLARTFASVFSREGLLGQLHDPPVQMTNYGAFHASQITIEVDNGRYIHFLFFVDSLRDYERGAFLGVNPIDAISEFVNKSLEAVVPQFSSEPGFKEGLTLVVGCGWGRSLVLKLPEDLHAWRIEMLSAHDMVTLGRHAHFRVLDLFRILDAQDAITKMGISLFNLNGFLNLYSWINSRDGHVVPHEKLDPDFLEKENAFLTIPQNSFLKIRHDVANAVDIHVVTRPDAGATLVRRLNGTARYGTKALSPFYADLRALTGREIACVYEGTRNQFWIRSLFDDQLDNETRFHLSNMVNNWGETVFRYWDKHDLHTAKYVLSCVVRFLDKRRPNIDDSIPDDAKITGLTNIKADNSEAEIIVGEGFLAAARRPDNTAEKSIVAALLKGCALCCSSNLSDDTVASIAGEIVGDVGARHFHAFTAPDVRDYLRESLPKNPQTIGRMDDANSRLGLGWLCRPRESGGDIEGRRECCSYLNTLVRAIGQQIKKEVARFDRIELVKRLLMNHEALFCEEATWKRTFRAVRALSEDKDLAFEQATDKIGRLNAASLASRIVAEIALCESPMTGGISPGRYDIGRLLADASQMFHLGGYSDAMNAEMMSARIRISPAGDVLMDHGFADRVVGPFGKKFQSMALNDAAERYQEYYEIVAEPEPIEVDGESRDFETAWESEFGCGISQVRSFVQALHKLAIEQGEAVFLINKSELYTALAEGMGTAADVFEKLLDLFTLEHRPRWDEAPHGFADAAWLPWRFRRQLSIVSRPILRLEEGDDARYIVAPAMIAHNIAKFLSDVRFGRLDETTFVKDGPLSRWVGHVNHLQGEAFNKMVADRFVEVGWEAGSNLTDGQILGGTNDPRFGDVDVLAWSEARRRVLAIECKELSLDKTFGEIARRLARYRGLIGANGKRDDLRKHLDRCETLYGARKRLSKFVGFDVEQVERVLIFSHPTPVQFHRAPAECNVSTLTISDIAEQFSISSSIG